MARVSSPERDRDRTVKANDPQADSAQPPERAAPRKPRPSSISLTELDEPYFVSSKRAAAPENENASELTAPGPPTEPMGPGEAEALDQRLDSLTPAALPDSDAVALTDGEAPQAAPEPQPEAAAREPDVSTRAWTHAAPERWFDRTLEIPGANTEPRQRLAWRFKAAYAAWKLLVPISPTPESRALATAAMRSYERLLRGAAPASSSDAQQQLSDSVHARLTDAQVVTCERALAELETTLLAIDESMSEDSFRAYFCRPQEQARTLLRYARFLGSRRFGIGYRRDRFEMLALELLSARLPSGKLLLMPRKRAGQVLQQLLRGLPRPQLDADAQASAIDHLHEALDRLASYGSAKQFFDSGYFLDVYGYKISMHDRITSPEYLYLCVALDVELHNRLQVWSQELYGAPAAGAKPLGSLAPLQVQLRAQQEAAQAVFADFHRPLTGKVPSGRATAKKTPKRPEAKPVVQAQVAQPHGWLRWAAASLLVLGALAGNLYGLGYFQSWSAPHPLQSAELKALSPLLQSAQLSPDGKRLDGLVARPAWRRLSARERSTEAARLAALLKRRGIEHALLLAYKARALQIDYGSVVFVDEGI